MYLALVNLSIIILGREDTYGIPFHVGWIYPFRYICMYALNQDGNRWWYCKHGWVVTITVSWLRAATLSSLHPRVQLMGSGLSPWLSLKVFIWTCVCVPVCLINMECMRIHVFIELFARRLMSACAFVYSLFFGPDHLSSLLHHTYMHKYISYVYIHIYVYIRRERSKIYSCMFLRKFLMLFTAF